MDEVLDGYEVLKNIGAQKIHEDTHIPKEHTRGLVGASFSNMNKIQFLGFVSILEREYSMKLDTLKQKGLEYFEANATEFTIAKKVFVPQKSKKSYKMYYVLIVAIIAVVFFISNMSPSTITNGSSLSLDDSRIENATKSIASKIEEVKLEQKKVREKKRLAATFKILPKDNLWVGYINLDTGEKLQKTFRDELSLDPNGHWLLTLGHGNVDFDVSGELKQYQTSRNLRFLYKDGKLNKIPTEEFTRLNKGEKW